MNERSLPKRLFGPLYDRLNSFRSRNKISQTEAESTEHLSQSVELHEEPAAGDPAIAAITDFVIQQFNHQNEVDRFNSDVMEYDSKVARQLPTLPAEQRDAWNIASNAAIRTIAVVPTINFPALNYIGATPDDIRSISRKRLATLAGCFQATRRFQELIALVEARKLPPLFAEAARFLQLTEAVGPIVIPLGPMNLDQFIMQPARVEDTPEYLDFFYEAVRIHTTLSPKVECEDEPFNQYPAITRELTKRAADLVIAGVTAETQGTSYSAKVNPLIDRKVLKLSQTVSTPFVEKRKLVNQVLLNPKSPRHQESVAALRKLEGDNSGRQFFFLYAANIAHSERLVRFYRQIVAEDPEPQFRDAYLETSRTIEQVVTEFSDINQVITKDDIPTMSDTRKDQSEIDLDKIHRQLTSIVFRRKSGHEFIIDPSQISGSGILPPEEVNLRFDPLNRCKFNLEFKYASEEDEPLKLTASFNTSKRQMDWNILNSPDEPADEIQQFKQAIFSAVLQILHKIKVITDVQKPIPEYPKNGDPRLPRAPKKTQYSDPAYQLRKELRQKSVSPAPLMEIPVDTTLELGQIISIEDQKSLDVLLEDILPMDRPAAIKAFEDFNEFSKGNFRPIVSPELITRGFDYRLRISAPGGSIRAFVQNVLNEKGLRVFVPVKLKYRKDAYR